MTDSYPDLLAKPLDPDFVEMIGRFEPEPPAMDDCGTRDWSELHQRMHYIAHLFRAFHLNERLADPPFTPSQVSAFAAGHVPSGEL